MVIMPRPTMTALASTKTINEREGKRCALLCCCFVRLVFVCVLLFRECNVFLRTRTAFIYCTAQVLTTQQASWTSGAVLVY